MGGYFIIQITDENSVLAESCTFIADGEGDPARTLLKENAKKFKNYLSAKKRLDKCKIDFPSRDFSEAKIIKCN